MCALVGPILSVEPVNLDIFSQEQLVLLLVQRELQLQHQIFVCPACDPVVLAWVRLHIALHVPKEFSTKGHVFRLARNLRIRRW